MEPLIVPLNREKGNVAVILSTGTDEIHIRLSTGREIDNLDQISDLKHARLEGNSAWQKLYEQHQDVINRVIHVLCIIIKYLDFEQSTKCCIVYQRAGLHSGTISFKNWLNFSRNENDALMKVTDPSFCIKK